MEKYLLNHIKDLESEIDRLKEKEVKLQKIVLNLKKLCQPILEINLINKDAKNKVNKFINILLNNLIIKDEYKRIYHKNGFLNKNSFYNLVNNFDLKSKLFFIFKLKESDEIDFSISFIESKFTSFLYKDINKIIGVIDRKQLKEFENTTFIPFFNNNKYEELKFFVMFFEVAEINSFEVKKMTNLFDRFFLKPSMSNKSFVHYSMIENKIIDFAVIEKEKIKKEFAYINELKYPEIENLIRKEIKNIKFVLALLDRIDNELKHIKKSKGTIIVVKRILSFIHKYQLDKQIQEMTNLIVQELNREEFI